jgi:hypothetical protein
MLAESDGGEGVFYPYTFINGQTYSISVQFTISGPPGTVTIDAANGLTQSQSTGNCESSLPTNNYHQLIGTLTNSSTSPASFAYTPSGGTTAIGAYEGYTQLWMYSTLTGTGAFSSQITSVSVCPVCSISTPTGLGTTNDESTLTWSAVSGASSYIIA